jgi:NhaC family Na+:H+ antiporter
VGQKGDGKVGTVTKGDTNIILSLNVLLIIMCIYFNISLILGFAGGIILSLIMLKKRGFQLDTLIKLMIKGVKPCTSVLIIIALMGCTISIWLASGIVPTIIYYGYNYIGEVNFVFACFLIAGVTSIFMGTALGTFSTIGMALYGLGSNNFRCVFSR